MRSVSRTRRQDEVSCRRREFGTAHSEIAISTPRSGPALCRYCRAWVVIVTALAPSANDSGGTSSRCAVRVGGHREVEDGATELAGGHPQPAAMRSMIERQIDR